LRRIGYHLITLLFAGLSVLGVRDVYNNYQTAETVLQVVDLVGQVLYTVCAAAVVLLRLGRQRREARRFMWAWAGALVWAGGLAPAAWGAAGWGASLTAAGASLAIAVVILLADAAASVRPKPL
jgi:hypothetical protein